MNSRLAILLALIWLPLTAYVMFRSQLGALGSYLLLPAIPSVIASPTGFLTGLAPVNVSSRSFLGRLARNIERSKAKKAERERLEELEKLKTTRSRSAFTVKAGDEDVSPPTTTSAAVSSVSGSSDSVILPAIVTGRPSVELASDSIVAR